jgi:hypothetical protein
MHQETLVVRNNVGQHQADGGKEQIFCAKPRIPLERIGIVDMGTPTTIISCRPIASITMASLCENAAIS